MFRPEVKLIVVSQRGVPDSAEEIHPDCYREGDVVVRQVTLEIQDNYRCDRCRKHIGKFVPVPLLDSDDYAALVDKLMHLNGEDLINVVSRALQLRADVKQPEVTGTAYGHYQQSSVLHYTPEPATDGHKYIGRAFEIIVQELQVDKVPPNLLSN